MFSKSVDRPETRDGARSFTASRPAHRQPTTTTSRRLAAVVAGALLAASLAPLAAVPASAETAGVGPIDEANGFPTWYSDGTVKLQLCYEAGMGCLAEPPNPDQPASYPDNFPDEAFWFAAEASGGNLDLYEAALEAAHANEAVIDGDQQGFARLRFRLSNLVAGENYTIQHPYGSHTFEAVDEEGVGVINETIDAGVCTPSPTVPCDWAAVGAAFLGDFGSGTTAAFLHQTNAPAGAIGDINAPGTVTGAPSGLNAVVVTGPDVGGPGIDTLTVTQFAVQGLIAEGTDGGPSTPDLAAASDSGRSSTDNITNVTAPTLTGTLPAGTEGPVELIVDGGAPLAATVTGSTYSLRLASLAQASHTVQARAGDLTSATLRFTVDTTAPTVALTTPLPSTPSLDNTPTLHFGSADAQARFECQLLPTNATWDATCASPKTWDAQANGAHIFNVRATDTAGNVSTTATRTLHIGQSVTAAKAKLQDFNSDGKADVVSRDSSGRLWLYRGNGTGGFIGKSLVGSGWNTMTSIVSPGDFSGDGRADIVARDTSGRLWLYRGNGAGGVGAKIQIGNGWNTLNAIFGPGDFNNDGRIDLAARNAAGNLFLYFGNGGGGFLGNALIGNGWGGMNSIVAPGDFNGDGKADLVARDAAGNLFLYRGDGGGAFLGKVQIGNGWNAMNSIMAPGDFNGDRKADLMARDSSGRLFLYRGSGTGSFVGNLQVGTGWNTMNSIS
ncbi:FG-GAP-like repeat-containing protein [Arthrobacter sp. ISL-28]|uniref:FG-GAP-like repeat-containing protein n=1 Tax=Arthrobacter sp. ISL-28 TaxID=2819108 RepID=UPI001BE78438|nr:FG-GAP-like repeat-containing protein [Arthrobacter sp. ISL-28]MBT2520281.1 VCBS repeat-containing protein [Arthrobacter sp. ISL-28]